MDAGKLVDDATVLGMIRERMTRPDVRKGFILDGFPRNNVQAEALGRLLEELKMPLEAVVLLEPRSQGAVQASHRPTHLRGLRAGVQHLHGAGNGARAL